MEKLSVKPDSRFLFILFTVCILILWTVLIFVLARQFISFQKESVLELVETEAVSHFRADWTFRQWASEMGGFYVFVDEDTLPNPRLSHVPEQNITTGSGRPLTLMNPAWALRSLNEFKNMENRTVGHITSLNLLREENRPDPWETEALFSFEKGRVDASGISYKEGVPFFRYMEPIYVETSCLKCHGYQGYEVGDIRGGISVSVPFSPYIAIEKAQVQSTVILFSSIYAAVFSGILLSAFLIFRKQEAVREGSLRLRESNIKLEQEVESSQKANQNLQQEIRKRQEAEKENLMLQSQLNYKSKMDGLGQLAGGVAHDFNNILNGISGAAELLQITNPDLSESSGKYVDMILSASERAADLVKKLLIYSKNSNSDYSCTDIHRILENAFALTENTVNRRIRMGLVKNARQSTVYGDPSDLETVFMNLIVNALHAVERDGEINVSTENLYYDKEFTDGSSFQVEPGQYVQIKVSDTGCGISPAIIDQIFNPFFTTREPGQGTGLGLTTVYNVMKNHKGSLEVTSLPGEGTTFTLALPCCEETEPSSSIKEELRTGQGTILVVDDEQYNRDILKEMLGHLGYKILTASDGIQSLQVYEEFREQINLVLLDMNMPGMDGQETLAKLSRLDPDCRIIFCSGYITREEPQKGAENRNVAGYLKKPFRLYELSEILEKSL